MNERLERLCERAGVGWFRSDLSGRLLDCSHSLAVMLGLENPAALLGRQTAEFYWSPAERDELAERLARDRRVDAVEVRLRHASGEMLWALASAQLSAEEPDAVEGSVLDISGRKRAEAHIARLSRMGSVLNGVARAAARDGDRGALLAEVCRIAVEDGGLRAAWFAEPDQAVRVMWPDVRMPIPPDTGRFLSNDLAKDAGVGAWPEEAAALGCRSCAVFPVPVKDGRCGVLGLYADEPGFFDRQTVELLGVAAAHLSLALENAAPDAILHCDAEGRILAVNAAAERLFACSQAELVERRIGELLPGSPSIGGTEEPLEIRLSRTQTSDHRIASILESITDGFFAVDREWRFTYLNGRAEQIVGRKRHEVQGKRLWDEFPEPAGSVFRQELERAFDTRRPIEFSAPYAPLNLWLDVHAYPSADGLAVYFQDITTRKIQEDQSRQSQRLEALGRLAGEVAHDFNNLLTVIGGHGQMALDSVDKSQGTLHRDIETVVEAAVRASALTRQLLAFSRRQVVQPRVLDLNRLVTRVARMLARMTREDIELRLQLRAGLWRVEADPGQIEQIVVNLAVNARDAMPTGGVLSIATENREVAGASGTPPLAPGSYILLAVSDTGRGLDPETRSHIFEPFFTTKAKGKGTGLGLATVYGIVKQSGGEIRVDSEPGKGARFEIYLPRTDKVAHRKKAARASPKPRGGRETILLVEDDPGVRKLAREMLARFGYRVLEAAGSYEALGIWENERSIDLLLTDIVMPQMNGRELAARLSESQPGLRTLYVTGYSGEVILERGVEADKAALLHKPFSAEALGRRVRAVLDAG
jgi:PAS domain S-box-containing protein